MKLNPSNIHRLIIAVLTFLIYSNTLFLHFALDDRMVILESKPTIKGGWESVKDIFTKDNFSGFFGSENSIVAGGRYRPMTQFTYMIECQLFAKNVKDKIANLDDYYSLHDANNEDYFYETPLPFVSHLMNVLYFILLCLILYEVLSKIFSKYDGKSWFQYLPFLAVLIFASHPIHTEAVANVKGRDEIFAFLGAMLSVLVSLKFVDTKKLHFLLLSFLTFSFAIFSKENAITFSAVIPLIIYYYDCQNKKTSDYILTLIPVLLGSVLFIAARYKVLGGFMPPDLTNNILNNPYLDSSTSQRIATVILTWGIYLRLLIFPHPLTHDYYPHQIAITNFSNPLVWIIILCTIALLVYAIINLKKKTVPVFAILFFAITFSITSNLLFNVGTFMNERFVFIPSLGFALIVAYLFYLLYNSNISIVKNSSLAIFLLTTALFGIKTFTRNFVWHDDITLFTTDVKTSTNSIKCNISAGGSYLRLWKKSHKEKDKKSAYKHLEKALQLDNHAINGYLLLSELAYLDDNANLSKQAAYNATLIDPYNQQAKNLLEQAEKKLENQDVDDAKKLLDQGNIDQALQKINEFLSKNPDNLYAKNMKGNILGRGFGQIDEAIAVFNEIVSEKPDYSSAWENLGICYAIKKDFKNSERCFLKAHELDPENVNIRANLRQMYTDMGEIEKAKKIE